MSYRCSSLCLAALLAFSAARAQSPPDAAAAPAPPNQAGTIVLAEGDAQIVPNGGKPRPAKVGDIVSEGDALVTGASGEIHMNMQDTGFIALRPNTRLRIMRYKADGDADDGAVMRLVKGGFRSVTGWIGKYSRSGYRINTPTATIGIRGTDHEPRYIPEGSAEGEPGTYDRVYVGSTFIENKEGAADVAPNQAGFVPEQGRVRPRLLSRVPGFFKPSRYEAEIAKKHAEIERQIDQRRDERREVIRKMRAELQESRAKAKTLREQTKSANEERKKEAQEQRENAQQQRKSLQQERDTVKGERSDVQQKRRELKDEIQSGKAQPAEIREKRKALREEAKSVRQETKGLQEQRKAMIEENKAAIQSRRKAAQDDRKAVQEQQQDAKDKKKALEEERKSAQEEIKGLRQQERERYQQELKEARKKRAAEKGADSDEKTQ